MTWNEKLSIGRSICRPLLRKILADVRWAQMDVGVQHHFSLDTGEHLSGRPSVQMDGGSSAGVGVGMTMPAGVGPAAAAAAAASGSCAPEYARLNAKYVTRGTVMSPERFVRTRLYFTSESHLHALFNCLRFGGLFPEQSLITDSTGAASGGSPPPHSDSPPLSLRLSGNSQSTLSFASNSSRDSTEDSVHCTRTTENTYPYCTRVLVVFLFLLLSF